MVGVPPSGLLAEDDGESDEFLCGVAAECINDALVVLDRVDTRAKAELRRALAMLVEQGTVSRSMLKPSQSLKAETSTRPTASGAEGDAKRPVANPATLPDLQSTGHAYAPYLEITTTRDRALSLLVEALSLLGDAENSALAAHVHVAIDRVRRAPPAAPNSARA